MMIASDVTGRDFVTNIISATVPLCDVHPEVREDLFRRCDELLNHARDATALASCQAIAMARFNAWLKGQIAAVAPSYELTTLGRVLSKWKELTDGNQGTTQSSGVNRGSDSAQNETHNSPPSPEGGRAFRDQLEAEQFRAGCSNCASACARFALQQAREQIEQLRNSFVIADDYEAGKESGSNSALGLVDTLLAQLASSSVPVREQQEQIENDHGGTRLTEVDAVSVLVPTSELPHDAKDEMIRELAAKLAECERVILSRQCEECAYVFSPNELLAEDASAWGHPCHQPNLIPGTPCESHRKFLRCVDGSQVGSASVSTEGHATVPMSAAHKSHSHTDTEPSS